MKALFVCALVVSVLAATPTAASAGPLGDFVAVDVRLEIPQKDLIPGIAAVRASCALNASGEALFVLANDTVRSTLAVSPGPCTITVVLAGVDLALPVFNTTPIGRSSFYLPGVATVSLGVVDVTIDLVTTLTSTTRVESAIADVSPADLSWPSWGAQRILVHGSDGFGSVARSTLNTTFTYTMSLALTVYAFSIEWYHVELTPIGSAIGAPSLRTDLSVDLRPHALVLSPPEAIRHDAATITWTGAVDSDTDHLELWLADGEHNVSVRLPPTAIEADVLLRPSTAYQAWIVAVDGGGQTTPSNGIRFDSAAAPTGGTPTSVQSLASPILTWTLIGMAILAGIVGYGLGFRKRRER